MPLPRPMATRAGPDAAASFSARRRAPDFRFRLPHGHAHARSYFDLLGGGFPLASDAVRRLDFTC